MRNEDTLIEVDRRFNDQREFINAKFTHLSAVMRNGFELAAKERTEIIEHQKTTNGRVNSLDDITKPLRRSNRKYIAIGLASCVVLISIGAVWGYSNIDAKKTLVNKTGIELKVDSLLNK